MPGNAAWITWTPGVSPVPTSDAVPAVSATGPPTGAPSIDSCTEPATGWGATVTVNVTVSPYVAGFSSDVTVVVVSARCTVCVIVSSLPS